jgi:hypothetical protein
MKNDFFYNWKTAHHEISFSDPIFDFMSGMGHTFGHNCLKRDIGFCLDYSSKLGA